MTRAYPLHWPDGWPRTSWEKRKAAAFHVKKDVHSESQDAAGNVRRYSYHQKANLSIHGAMRRLTDELSRLGARELVTSTNVETNLDGQPHGNRKAPDDPGVAIYFSLKGKSIAMACDKWDTVPGNIAAIAGHIDAIRRQERYGVGSLDRVFAGYAALEAPGRKHWSAILGISPGPGASRDRIQAAYKSLAFERHPDRHGGSNAAMAELNAARDAALREIGS